MKSNKGLYVIIGILVAIILLLIVGIGGIIGVALIVRGNNGNNNVVNTTGGNATIINNVPDADTPTADKDPEIVDGGITNPDTPSNDADGGKVVIERENYDTKPGTLVFQGFEFTIPEEFGVGFLDDLGAYIYMNDIFQTRFAVVEESEEEFAKYEEDPSLLQKKAEAAGGIIINPATEDLVNGYKILHFRADSEGDDCFVFRTRLNDKYSFAGNIIVLSKTVSENDLLNVITTLASSAVKTDKPDTTKEEYIGAKIDGTIGEVVTEGTIESDKTAVTYQVTEGFTFRGNESDDNRVYDIYMSNMFDQVYLFLIEYDGDAKAYTEEHYLFNGKLNTFEKNGRTYYYNEEHEKTADYDATRIIAATDAGNGMLYIVDLDTARNMQIGDVEEFFDIKIK